MEKLEKPMWRTHPVLFAALIGAIIGAANVILLEIGGLLNRNSSAALSLLWPNPILGTGSHQATIMQTAMVLLIEVGANVLVWALILALPVGLVVLVRRAVRGRAAK